MNGKQTAEKKLPIATDEQDIIVPTTANDDSAAPSYVYNQNYANQEPQQRAPRDGEITSELHKKWQLERRTGTESQDTIDALKTCAAAGSIVAGRLLHLASIEWDEIVGNERFVYDEPKPVQTGYYTPQTTSEQGITLSPNILEMLKRQNLKVIAHDLTQLNPRFIADAEWPHVDES